MTTQSTLAYRDPLPSLLPWRVVLLCAACIALGLLLALTLGADPPRPQFLQGQDKLEHFIAFGGVSLLFMAGGSLVSAALVSLALSGCAIAIEAMQTLYVPGREGSVEDALAGMAGVALGAGLAMLASVVVSQTAKSRLRISRATKAR